MAVSLTLLTSSYDNVDRSTYTTASVSVTTGDYLLLFVNTMSASTAATATVSGLSSTWTEAKTQQYSSVNRKLSLFRTTATSTTSGTISIAAASSVGCAWALFKATGVPTSNPIVQVVSSSGTGTTGTVTLASASSSSNRVLSCFSHRANEATTPRASWTELSDNNGATPSTGFETQWYSSAIETTASATWSTSSDWGGIAVELADSATATTPRVLKLGTTSGARAQVTLSVEVAFWATPTDPSPPWTEISPWVRSLNVRRGRSNELDQASAGTATLVLDNRDRRFDPLHASGPHYGALQPRRQLRIRATYAGITYPIFRGHIEGWPQEYDPPRDATVTLTAVDPFGLFAGYELPPDDYALEVLSDSPTAYYRCSGGGNSWTDYSGNGHHGVALYPGFADGLIAAEDKAMAISSDGLEDGSVGFMTTAYVPDGMGKADWGDEMTLEFWTWRDPNYANPFNRDFIIQAELYISVRVTDNLVTVSGSNVALGTVSFPVLLSTGTHHIVAVMDATDLRLYVDGVLVGAQATTGTAVFVGNLDGVANFRYEGPWTYSVVDEVAFYGAALTATQVADHYAAGVSAHRMETTGERAQRIVDAVGWPTSSSLMGSSVFTGASYCSEFRPSGSALAVLQQLADTEQGRCFVAADGSVKFLGRPTLWATAVYNTSQATFGDGPGELACSDVMFTRDLVPLFNRMELTRAPGNQVVRGEDLTSQQAYGIRTRSLTVQNSNDDDASNLIQYRIGKRGLYKDPQTRVPSITIQPQRDPANLFPQVLGRDLGERVTVKRRPQGVGNPISADVSVEGIEHVVTRDSWETHWLLGIPDPAATDAGYWVVGNATYGKVGTAKVGP